MKPFYRKDGIEAGCDEAGRGCLAGPVYAAAVILPKGFQHPLLNDSKKLSASLTSLYLPCNDRFAVAIEFPVSSSAVSVIFANTKKPGLLLGNTYEAFFFLRFFFGLPFLFLLDFPFKLCMSY